MARSGSELMATAFFLNEGAVLLMRRSQHAKLFIVCEPMRCELSTFTLG